MDIYNIQGEVDTTGTILITGTASDLVYNISVNPIRIYNDLASVFDLYKYDSDSRTEIKLYSISLSAKQIYLDIYNYILKEGEYLKAYSNISGTTFIITVLDKSLN